LVRLNLNREGNKPIEESPFILTRLAEPSSTTENTTSDLATEVTQFSQKILNFFQKDTQKPVNLTHTRIYRQNGAFVIFLKEGTMVKQETQSIISFITYIEQNHKNICSTPCKRWPFKKLFLQDQEDNRVVPYEELGS